MKIKCTNKRCGHEWDYKGSSKFYVTCPQCYNKVKINERRDKKENGIKT